MIEHIARRRISGRNAADAMEQSFGQRPLTIPQLEDTNTYSIAPNIRFDDFRFQDKLAYDYYSESTLRAYRYFLLSCRSLHLFPALSDSSARAARLPIAYSPPAAGATIFARYYYMLRALSPAATQHSHFKQNYFAHAFANA